MGELPGYSRDALFLGLHVGYVCVFQLPMYHLRFVHILVCFYLCKIYVKEV